MKHTCNIVRLRNCGGKDFYPRYFKEMSFYSSLFYDTTLTISHPNYDQLVPILNHELESIILWTKSNKLTVNVSKTDLMLISNRSVNNSGQDILLDNEYLNFKSQCKFLGVELDNRLNFSNHIQYITNKLPRSTGIFYKIRNNLSRKAKLDYYYAFFYPYIVYNILIWGGTYQTHLNPLILEQKRIIRLIAILIFLPLPLLYF